LRKLLRGTHDQPKALVMALAEPEMPEDSEPEEQVPAIPTGPERSASGPAWLLPSRNFPGCGS